MDCSDEFIRILGSERFTTHKGFTENLEKFQTVCYPFEVRLPSQVTQTYYRPTNSTYFPSDTVERRLLVHKYIRFACEMHRKPIVKNKIQ